MKVGPVTSAENRLENGNCAETWPQYDGRRSFGTLAFENRLEYRNSDFSRLIVIISLHLVKISMRFGLVTPKFKT